MVAGGVFGPRPFWCRRGAVRRPGLAERRGGGVRRCRADGGPLTAPRHCAALRTGARTGARRGRGLQPAGSLCTRGRWGTNSAFPADAQDIPDEEWIAHGLAQSWVPLSKDGRIKTRDVEIRPVLDHGAVLFYLDNQQLRSFEMVERLDARRSDIYRAVEKGGPAAYAVRLDRIERTWP
ncbi:hypothetical protein [Streptomyces sp. NPDC002088]|uniref:PIN-like domain-containing protein n=1 Tax=Streptomyces sp. NPDC002088 TaxID=3154665 RepID=UPI00332C7613